MKYGLIILLLLFCTALFAQQKALNKKLVQFSGIITETDSNTVVPYVTITNLTNKGQRYAANYQGYFSFIVNPGDSLLFTAIGFTNKPFVVPENLPDNKFTVMIKLKSEITYLQTVRIYPWATTEEYTKDFMSLKIADDDFALAIKNLSPESISNMSRNLPRDGSEISSSNYRANHFRELNKNMRQMNPFINPFAWGSLMQQIFSGDKSRKSGK